jgi:hypothetical protein
MADWAIVIGVDKYLIPNASLRGAVRDALEMRRWLIEEGRVPEENIALLLAPDTEPVPAGIEYLEPTYENIITSIDSTLMKSASRSSRSRKQGLHRSGGTRPGPGTHSPERPSPWPM